MSMRVEVVDAELLRLPVVERARVLDRVVASLDSDAARDRAWDELAAGRDAEIESGAVAVIPGLEILARLRSELR